MFQMFLNDVHQKLAKKKLYGKAQKFITGEHKLAISTYRNVWKRLQNPINHETQ